MAALTIDPVEQPRMYQQTLLQDGLCDLLENEKFVDCVLKVQDQEFPCHRLVLAASSPFFKAMFLSELEESKKRTIELKDVEPGVMGMILRYLYTSDLSLTEHNVQDIFMVANMYQIPSIFSVCVTFLQEKLVLGNCLAIFRLGLLLDCARLALVAREFICERYQVIVRDKDFLQLGPGELAAIITSDALNVDREETVFESLMEWVGHDKVGRFKDLVELLHCVRFRLIPQDYFQEKVERHPYIQMNPETKKDLDLVKDAHRGRLPKPSKPGRQGVKGGAGKEDGDKEEAEAEEQGLLPGILNNNPRFGMFETELVLMISDKGMVAYDPVGNECYVASQSTEIPKSHCSLVTEQNQVFVAGGLLYNEKDKDEPLSSYFLQFDPVSSQWLGMPSLPNPRCLFGLTEAQNSIYVVGGKELKEGEHVLDSVMIYDRQSFKWGESDPLPYSVYGHGTVSHDGIVYVLGGKSESKRCLKRVCMYDPRKFEWKDLAPMKRARSLFGIAVHNDQIYVAAGVTDTGLTDTVEVYDIATNKYDSLLCLFYVVNRREKNPCVFTVVVEVSDRCGHMVNG
ncbi:hypothetical protein NHX12_004992 [Muraenolepis orangiensis]|uniref:BTB domain-containing protein n=1 Tax=Muraenolepis orangiensis TaxID=630683 RepID=A0A9Q0IEF2_9TELE|nr:hypothetical protein NHX12_004992 [Muraenolepis orangiensis]